MINLSLIGIILIFLVIIRLIFSDYPTLKQYVQWFLSFKTIDLKARYGNWAVITGASDGIGKAYSFELARRGINVAIVGRNQEKLANVAKEIEKKHNVEVKIIIADFSKGQEIYANLKEELSAIDVGILVNNVGIQYEYPMAVADLPDKEIWDNVNVNILPTVMITKIVLPQMIAKKNGAIVNISSASSVTPQPYMNLYAASKAYVTYFSEALRWEVQRHNITVQTLIPFYISSKINHFQPEIQKVGVLIPDVDTYAKSALNCLGIIDNSTGYWSHRVLMFYYLMVPSYLRTIYLGVKYRLYNKQYLAKKGS